MRSTWVNTIRRQQYLFSCSSSRASLSKEGRKEYNNAWVSKIVGRSKRSGDAPFALVLRKQLKIGIPFVSHHLSARKTTNWNDLVKRSEMHIRRRKTESIPSWTLTAKSVAYDSYEVAKVRVNGKCQVAHVARHPFATLFLGLPP